MDVNENVITGEWHTALKNIALKEAITDRHEESKGLVPTFQLGLVPINSIFISEVLNIMLGGYFLFRLSPSDHRALQIKLKVDLIFGYNFYQCTPVVVHRVKCNDQRVVNRFQHLYLSYLKEHKLFNRIYTVQNKIKEGIQSTTKIEEYEEI